MRKQTTAIMTFALALGISIPLAAQSPSSSPNSQPATQEQAPASPAQSPQEQAPAQAPQAQTPPSQQQATPPAAAQQRDPVAEALKLTDDQQAKLQPIIQEEMSQINAVRSDTSLTPDQKQQKVDQIRQTQFPKIQAVLTPDQRKKLAEMQEQAKQRANQGNPPANNSSQPPQ